MDRGNGGNAMVDDMDRRWADFEKLGEKEVLQRLANKTYGEANISAARAWLHHKESQMSAEVVEEELGISRKAAASAEKAAAASENSAAAALRSAAAVEAQSSIMQSARNEARIAMITAIIVAVIEIIDKWDKIKSIFTP